jgi:hypothetical protein
MQPVVLHDMAFDTCVLQKEECLLKLPHLKKGLMMKRAAIWKAV